ncbi:MAG: flagellar basal body-associated FliL family protein [Myxococcota bacterium]|jgi:flagellar FliL protein|nr:flagellar basal body-associated FliL family protein [Myxococcota bacterium]
MAKDDKEEQQDEGGGIPWMLIIGAVVLSLAAGASGAVFFLGNKTPPAPPPDLEAQAAAAAELREAEGEGFKERLYSLEPFVVNVTGDGYSRYLKVKVELEADTPELKTELDARLSQVRDAVIVLLSSKKLSDITDFEGKALLKQDIYERVNDILETGELNSVLFTEFVVQ